MTHETRLCQDEDGKDARKLSQWFASRPGARARLAASLMKAHEMTRDIQTRGQYETGMSELSRLMDEDPAPESPKGLRLSALATALEAWERAEYPHLFPTDPGNDWLTHFNRAWLAVPVRYRLRATEEVGLDEPFDYLRLAVQAMARDLAGQPK